jgi:ABC-2 type transport system permease protein
MTNNTKHMGYLLKTNLKQNRLKSLVWLVVLVGLFAGAASKFNMLFGTESDIAAIVTTLKTPAMVSLLGEFTANTPYHTADVFASEMMIFMGIFMIFMNYGITVANTRAQEESGLTEMVRSRQVGRSASFVATFLEIFCLNVITGALYVVSLIAAQLNGATLAGDLLTGAILAAVGLFFGMASLLFAQLANSARTASFLGYIFFGICYIVRMVTDVTNPQLSWISPLGWLTKARIYSTNNWLPVVLLLAGTVVLFGATLTITKTRDIGAGLINIGDGKSKASRFLQSPLSLILKVERNSIIVWVVLLFILGGTYGSIFGTIGDIIGANPTYRKLLNVTQVNEANLQLLLSYINMISVFFVAVAAVSGLMIVFRLNGDEKKGYLEIVHSKMVSRLKLALSYYVVALGTAILGVVASVAATFIVGNTGIKDPIPMTYCWQTLGATIPAVVFFVSIAFFVVCVSPRFTGVVYGYLGISVVFRMFSTLLDLPKGLNNISPFGWLGEVPAESANSVAVVVLLVAFVVLSVLGLIGYQKRDL